MTEQINKIYKFKSQVLGLRNHSSESAFSLVELLVSVVIISVIGVALASVFNAGNNSFQRTRDSNLLESTIDGDLSVIKDIAFRLTCCSGSCTIDQSIISGSTSCTTNAPGNQNYYFPEPGLSNDDTPQITNFKSACSSSELINSFVSAIESESNPLPQGITRSFDTSRAARHRLTINYSGADQTRSYTVSPTVAAWCP